MKMTIKEQADAYRLKQATKLLEDSGFVQLHDGNFRELGTMTRREIMREKRARRKAK